MIDFIGGEYENRTRVHGFARLGMSMNTLNYVFRAVVV